MADRRFSIYAKQTQALCTTVCMIGIMLAVPDKSVLAQDDGAGNVSKFFNRDISSGFFNKLCVLNKHLDKTNSKTANRASERDYDIWVMRPNRFETPYALTLDTKWDDMMPDWSPDDQFLVYVSNYSGKKKIWRMRNDGTGKERITDGDGDDQLPRWSPDGEKIAFIRAHALYFVDVRNRHERLILPGIYVENICSWSRDGASILLLIKENDHARFVELDLAAGQMTNVELDANLNRIWSDIKLHPKQDTVVYQELRQGNFDIALFDFSDRPQYLTDSFKHDFYPAWSSSGNLIAFTSNRPSPDLTGK